MSAGNNGPAPTHSAPPVFSRRRGRRGTAAGGTALLLSRSDSQLKGYRPPLLSWFSNALADLFFSPSSPCCCCWTAITVRCALLTCACGVAWACLIVWILGPAGYSATPGKLSGHRPPAASLRTGGRNQEFLFPGWTSLGHHARFMGREAFPEQFEFWGGEKREMVVNNVDVAPLVPEGDQTDIVMAILSGNDEEARLKRDTLRELYDKYDGWVRVGGKIPGARGRGSAEMPVADMSFRVIFVVTSSSAPPHGQLVGDVLYVNAPDGYRNIVHKVKQMMGLVRHIDFKYLLKADDDTFVCVERIANFLHQQPEENKDKLYAGVPTACNLPGNPSKHIGHVIKDPQDKWYDERFLHHTLAGMDCYPVYMQGAFYALAQPLVEHLYRGREHYDTFVNEDVTIGSWLLGVDRTLATIHDFGSSRLWNCVCGSNIILRPVVTNKQVFFHDCKRSSQLLQCSNRLVRPNLKC